MSVLADARAHLLNAEEFLAAAELSESVQLFNAATSNAVTSGINSKDAICLTLTGRTAKTDDHIDAVAELRSAGPLVRQHATTLGRLLKLKNRAQYQTADVARTDARNAIDWARRLLAGATEIVTG